MLSHWPEISKVTLGANNCSKFEESQECRASDQVSRPKLGILMIRVKLQKQGDGHGTSEHRKTAEAACSAEVRNSLGEHQGQ